tara:strand:+ start:1934 stop:3223 length:1290 start_codon:yes stop_codon:yes gene_type:complete
MSSSKELPSKLKEIIMSRNDLLALDFQNLNNERLLVGWLLKHGQYEYPNLLEGDINNNEILEWLSTPSSDINYKSLPKIILGIWESNSSHKRKWSNPQEGRLYEIWLRHEWSNINIILPTYRNIFKENKINKIHSNLIYFLIRIGLIFRILDNLVSSYFEISSINKSIRTKIDGWIIQRNVVDGLVYRELKTRVSTAKFGVIGVFIEPLGQIFMFLLLFSLIRGNNRGSLDIILYLASGICLFSVFSDIGIRSANAMIANEALFFYRRVKPIDTVIARTIVETGLYSIVFITIIIGCYLLREEIILNDITLLILSCFGLVIYSLGLGIFLMVSAHVYPIVLQLIPIVMRPLWFISGVVISLNSLPQWLRPYISWNPVLQAIELVRHAFSTNYVIRSDEVSLLYLWQCALISLCLGLWIYTSNEKRLLTR